ncbi:MAG: cupredoxin family copper-binding protein [Candidatus Limnocylindrales bacterium]
MPAGFLLALATAACGGGTVPGAAASPAPGTVDLVKFQFSPRTLEIASGTSLTFVNKDAAAHTVTEGSDGSPAPGGRFDDRLDEGHQVVISFAAPGTYQITCKFHPTMSMTVNVRP